MARWVLFSWSALEGSVAGEGKGMRRWLPDERVRVYEKERRVYCKSALRVGVAPVKCEACHGGGQDLF